MAESGIYGANLVTVVRLTSIPNFTLFVLLKGDGNDALGTSRSRALPCCSRATCASALRIHHIQQQCCSRRLLSHSGFDPFFPLALNSLRLGGWQPDASRKPLRVATRDGEESYMGVSEQCYAKEDDPSIWNSFFRRAAVTQRRARPAMGRRHPGPQRVARVSLGR